MLKHISQRKKKKKKKLLYLVVLAANALEYTMEEESKQSKQKNIQEASTKTTCKLNETQVEEKK